MGLLKVLLAFYIAFIYCACVFLIATVGVHKDKCLHHKTTHTQHHHDGLLWPSLADATDLFFCFRPNCYKKRNNNNSKLEREAFSGKVGSIPSGFYFWVVMGRVLVDTKKRLSGTQNSARISNKLYQSKELLKVFGNYHTPTLPHEEF